MNYFIKPNENCVRLILRQLRLRGVKDFLFKVTWTVKADRAGIKGRVSLSPETWLFPTFQSASRMYVCVCVRVCKYSLLVWSSLVKVEKERRDFGKGSGIPTHLESSSSVPTQSGSLYIVMKGWVSWSPDSFPAVTLNLGIFCWWKIQNVILCLSLWCLYSSFTFPRYLHFSKHIFLPRN